MQNEPVLVRIHSQCLTGDIFGSKLCDCGSQLHQAMQQVAEAGRGVILYMRKKGEASACWRNCRRTSYRRKKAWTRCKRTSVSASARTCATTASAPKSSLIWAFARCGY